jgi:hypothetical protein
MVDAVDNLLLLFLLEGDKIIRWRWVESRINWKYDILNIIIILLLLIKVDIFIFYCYVIYNLILSSFLFLIFKVWFTVEKWNSVGFRSIGRRKGCYYSSCNKYIYIYVLCNLSSFFL